MTMTMAMMMPQFLCPGDVSVMILKSNRNGSVFVFGWFVWKESIGHNGDV